MRRRLDEEWLEDIETAQEKIDTAVAELNAAVERWEDSLRAAHEEGGFTLTELGRRLGVSRQRVSQIINPKPR